MPLSEAEIAAITEYLDGDTESENPRGLEQMLSDVCGTREQLRVLLAIHETIPDASCDTIRDNAISTIQAIGTEIEGLSL